VGIIFKRKIYLITINRPDAIGMVQNEIVKKLRERNINFSNISLFLTENTGAIKRTVLVVINFIRLFAVNLRPNSIYHYLSHANIYPIFNLIVKKRRSIITVHHIERKKIHKVELKKILDSFSIIIAISNFTKEQLIVDVGISNNKIVIINNGINNKVFRPVGKYSSQKDYILFVGSELERKNFDRLLKAFKIVKEKYPNIILKKVGYALIYDKSKYTFKTKKLIEKLNLKIGVDIEFMGGVSESELIKLYSNAKLFIFPSLLEGFGLPVVEAMACGCPVVTSNRPPMIELVGDTQVLVNPEDVLSIAEGISLVLSNREKRKKMSYDGVLRSKEFSWDKTVNQIIEIYNNQ
jgi:glycosyltransferase involved in cell wall biosynthesis